MSVSNPAEIVAGIMILIDQVRSKMDGARLGAIPWRPASPEAADELVGSAHEALQRCDDVTEAVIVVTVAAMTLAAPKSDRR